MKVQENIRLLSRFNFFTDFIFFAPVAIIYFAQVTGSYARGMSVFSVAYVSSALFEVPTGVLSDMVGRRKTVILGSLSSIVCITFYATGSSYGVMIVGALFQGLSRAFFSGNNDALLHDTLLQMKNDQNYHTYLGKTSAMFQFALAGASLIGGFLASVSLRLAVWLTLLPQLAALFTAFQFVEPAVTSEEKTNIFVHLKKAVKGFRSSSKLRLLTVISVVRHAVGETMFFLKSAFIEMLWPIWALGASRMVVHLSAALSFYYSGKVIDMFGSKRVLYAETIINRCINYVAFVFPSVVSPLLLSTTSLMYGVNTVAINSLMQKEYTQNQRATMSSLNALLGSIMFGIVAVLFGRIADTTSVATALIIANTALLILPLLYTRLKT